MDNTNLDNTKRKLEKLIKLQQSAEKIGSQEEAQSAALKISELLTKYNISLMELDVSEKPQDNVLRGDLDFVVNKKWGNNQKVFLSIIQKYSFTKIITYSSKLIIIGDSNNVECCKHMILYFWDYLKVCLASDMRKCKQGDMYGVGHLQKPGAFKRDYLAGYNSGLRSVLATHMASLKEVGTALILYNDKAINNYIKEHFGAITTNQIKTKTRISDAHIMGNRAGNTANPSRPPMLRG